MKTRFARWRALRNQRGQSVLEYVLMMAIVVGALLLIMGKLKQSQFFYKRFTEPLVKHVTYNYKYADPRAQGWDEGTPRLHIQQSKPGNNTFRIFQPRK